MEDGEGTGGRCVCAYAWSGERKSSSFKTDVTFPAREVQLPLAACSPPAGEKAAQRGLGTDADPQPAPALVPVSSRVIFLPTPRFSCWQPQASMDRGEKARMI